MCVWGVLFDIMKGGGVMGGVSGGVGIKLSKRTVNGNKSLLLGDWMVVVVVDLLFYVHGKHLRSCRDGQLT